ncbi:cellulose synthase operon protein YhjQ [Paraburkholderia sp. Ac-20340]|uniref:cellulose biosynthesis protein BcsQ n=1 Tax=Paraburkholderia sp. Ac-20340 TaxID=2703888 RepID=UPI00197FC67F|nr:cellulose biosynthesis protein BcsQ [Paraburkholderia sp. Ac-20340]MBN3854965.1 cellulose synthase operon protein YhjQ [Paraburkholderia sp. Ac-20340]
MIVVAVVSAKGGVGKSTIAANLAVELTRRARTVLALDLDPQNALHLHLGGKPEAYFGLSRASVGDTSWREVCERTTSGVSVLPFGQLNESDMQALERRIADDPHWLSRHLQSLKLPDDALVLLDTPPGVSNFSRQALGVADLVISVVLADAASYATLPQIENLIRRHHGKREAVCLINQADDTRALSREAAQLIQRALGERVLARVRADRAVSEALAQGRTVVESSQESVGRTDLIACADRVLELLPTLRVPTAAIDIATQARAQQSEQSTEQLQPTNANGDSDREPAVSMRLADDDRRAAAPVASARKTGVIRVMAVLSGVVLVLLIALWIRARQG